MDSEAGRLVPEIVVSERQLQGIVKNQSHQAPTCDPGGTVSRQNSRRF